MIPESRGRGVTPMGKSKEPRQYIIDLSEKDPDIGEEFDIDFTYELFQLALEASEKRKHLDEIEDEDERLQALKEAELLDREIIASITADKKSKHPEKLN